MKNLRVKICVFLYKTQIYDDKISSLREFYFDLINHKFGWIMDCCVKAYTKVIYIRASKWNSTTIEVDLELWKLKQIHRFRQKFVAQWRGCKVEVKTSQSRGGFIKKNLLMELEWGWSGGGGGSEGIHVEVKEEFLNLRYTISYLTLNVTRFLSNKFL
jgi:hypothetical protein